MCSSAAVPGCTSSGSAQLMEEFEAQLAANGLENEVEIVKTGCFGLCALGPRCGSLSGGRFLQQST